VRHPSDRSLAPSGETWLGDVPASWDVCAIAYRYEVALGKMLDEKRIVGTALAPYLRNVDVQWGRINTDDLPAMDFLGGDLERYALRAGDLLVCEGGEVGRSAIWTAPIEPCFYQKALHRLRARDQARDHPRFIQHCLRAAADRGVFAGAEGKSTIAHLTAEALRRYRFPFPPRDEQAAIATFLDGETAKIDALMEEQLRLIELLQEKRQAIISHVVTKGLDPAAKMKPSGVEWLGDVPAHWEVHPLKFVVRFESGGTPNKGNPDYWDGDVPWASAKDLKSDVLATTQDFITRAALHKGAASLVESGSVVVLVRGMMLARMFPVVLLSASMAINQDLKALTSAALRGDFLAWTLRGTEAETRSRLDEAGHGTKALRMEAWTSMEVPVPPSNEQGAIADYLNSYTQNIDELMRLTDESIALLDERRSALISAAVTGKIDLRNDRAQVAA
jgi:type I restriction enzyme S subunit